MPYSVTLSRVLKSQGWKVKIRDRERLEPPHVTVLHKTRAWRINLRTGQFMDDSPDPNEVPAGVVDTIRANWDALHGAWDAMYPSNPVEGVAGGDEE